MDAGSIQPFGSSKELFVNQARKAACMKSARNILHLGLDVHKETIAVSLRDLTQPPSQLPATVDRAAELWSVTTDKKTSASSTSSAQSAQSVVKDNVCTSSGAIADEASPATWPMRSHACNHTAMAGFAAAHGQTVGAASQSFSILPSYASSRWHLVSAPFGWSPGQRAPDTRYCPCLP